MSRVLDLRKKHKQRIDTKSVKVSAEKSSKIPEIKEQNKPRPASPEISWEANSFYYNPQKRYLILIIIALAAAGGAMLLFQKDTLMAIFLIMSSLVLVLYSNKKPEIFKIKIDQRGVVVGEDVHQYKDLRSFWINYDPKDVKELSLESKKWYLPYIKVSIENKNPLTIRSMLINFLPEKEHEQSLVDIISRKIGL